MKRMTTWMVIMAMAVSPFFAQEGEPSETEEEQQTEQVSEEAVVDEAVPEPESEPREWESVPSETEEEQEIDQVIDEAMGTEAEPEAEIEPREWESEPQQLESEPQEWESEPQEWETEPQEWESKPQGRHHRRQPREVRTLMTGSGGYGALSLGYTEINNQPSLMMGARAEWVLGHGFGIGIAGVGFASDHEVVGEYSYGLAGGYGGLVLEPIILGWFPIHIALPVMIGAGGVSNYAVNTDYWYSEDYEPEFKTYAGFFVVEAGAELEFNLVRAVRLSIFGNYRWTPDLNWRGYYGITEPYPEDYAGPSSNALNSWSAGVRFKFGSF